MGQLRRGGGQILDRLLALCREAQANHRDAYANAKHNPALSREAIDAADARVSDLMDLIDNELRDMLRRADGGGKLAELEERIEALEKASLRVVRAS